MSASKFSEIFRFSVIRPAQKKQNQQSFRRIRASDFIDDKQIHSFIETSGKSAISNQESSLNLKLDSVTRKIYTEKLTSIDDWKRLFNESSIALESSLLRQRINQEMLQAISDLEKNEKQVEETIDTHLGRIRTAFIGLVLAENDSRYEMKDIKSILNAPIELPSLSTIKQWDWSQHNQSGAIQVLDKSKVRNVLDSLNSLDKKHLKETELEEVTPYHSQTLSVADLFKLPQETQEIFSLAQVEPSDNFSEIVSKLEKYSEDERNFSTQENSGDIVRIGSSNIHRSDLLSQNMQNFAVETTVQPAIGAVQSLGVADLIRVEQKLKGYRYGEISHIENVLEGERRERQHQRSHSYESGEIFEQEEVEETEKSLQSAERFELKEQVQSQIESQNATGLSGQISASYGPFIKADTAFNSSTGSSSSRTQNQANSYAREITEKAALSLRSKTRRIRTRKTREQYEEHNIHSFEAQSGDIVGVYRWLEKVYEVKNVNYGKRLILEFIVPEPAAAIIYDIAKSSVSETLKPSPPMHVMNGKDRRLLEPQDINEENVSKIAAQYGITNLPTLIPKHIMVGESITFDMGRGGKDEEARKSRGARGSKGVITVPPEYEALSVTARVSNRVPSGSNNEVGIVVGPVKDVLLESKDKFTHMLSKVKGKLPFAVEANEARGIWAITITVHCQRTKEEEAKWKSSVFSAVQNAYREMLADFQDEQAAPQEQLPGQPKQPVPAPVLRQIETAEIKRNCIELLRQGAFLGTRETIIRDHKSLSENKKDVIGPLTNFSTMKDFSEEVRFYESVFEWDQSVHTFLPYYWAHRTRWTTLRQITHEDLEHQAFLQAGAARVQVPVALGQEKSILNLFATHKTVDASVLRSPIILEEHFDLFQEFQNEPVFRQPTPTPTTLKAPETWEIRVPTSLVMLDKDRSAIIE